MFRKTVVMALCAAAFAASSPAMATDWWSSFGWSSYPKPCKKGCQSGSSSSSSTSTSSSTTSSSSSGGSSTSTTSGGSTGGTAVPEPGTMGLFGLGLAALALRSRRRKFA